MGTRPTPLIACTPALCMLPELAGWIINMPILIQPSFPDHDAGSNKKLKMLIELWWPKETARRAREVAEDQGEH